MELLCNNYPKKPDTQHTVSESSSTGKGMAQEGFRLRTFTPFKSMHLLELPGCCTYSKEKNLNPLKRFSVALRLKADLSHKKKILA